jgi:uncharacterized protein YycO
VIRLHFVAGSGLPSRLISWWGNGYHGFSHVDAVLPDGTLLGARSDVIGDVPAGVQIRPPDYEKWLRQATVTIQTDKGAQWEAFLRSQVGLPYDELNIINLITGEPTPEKDGHWICSALQTAALEIIGILKPPPIPPQQYTPDSLYLVASALA